MPKPATLIAIATLAMLVLAVALNPSPDKHRAKIKESIGQRSQIAGALGIGALTAFTSTYRSVGVASYTVVNDQTVSIGAFGVVVVVQ